MIFDRIGLCASCEHKKIVENERGSRFVMCRLSKTDPSFPKYPALPVLSCPGYVMEVSQDDSAKHKTT
jgi:hypothetical protein